MKQFKEYMVEALAKDYSGMIGQFVKHVKAADKEKDDKKRDRHLDQARNKLMGMKNSDISKLEGIPEYALYNKMRGMDESSSMGPITSKDKKKAKELADESSSMGPITSKDKKKAMAMADESYGGPIKKVEEDVPATSTANVDFTPTKRDKRKKDDTDKMFKRAQGTKFIEKILLNRKK